jgi:hypothetical protein
MTEEEYQALAEHSMEEIDKKLKAIRKFNTLSH